MWFDYLVLQFDSSCVNERKRLATLIPGFEWSTVVWCFLIPAQKNCIGTHEIVRTIYCFLFLTSQLVKNCTHENESNISLGGATNFTRSLFLFAHSNLIWGQYHFECFKSEGGEGQCKTFVCSVIYSCVLKALPTQYESSHTRLLAQFCSLSCFGLGSVLQSGTLSLPNLVPQIERRRRVNSIKGCFIH